MRAYTDRDVTTLAKTLSGEARGEPTAGKVAVAFVILNRADRRAFAGDLAGQGGAVEAVCLAPWQFSCWNESDPNRERLLELEPEGYAGELEIARTALSGRTVDPTRGADSYHTLEAPAGADVWPPKWAAVMPEKARIGGHVFYNSQEVLMLSEHFSLPELTFTQQRGLDNTPTPEVVTALRETAAILEQVRAFLGGKPITVTSGYRSLAVNSAVGGVSNSAHVLGRAADFICPSFGTPLEVCRAIAGSNIAFDQLIHEFGAWVHIAWAPGPRRQVLTIDAGGTRAGLA